MCTMCVQYPRRPEEDIRLLGLEFQKVASQEMGAWNWMAASARESSAVHGWAASIASPYYANLT